MNEEEDEILRLRNEISESRKLSVNLKALCMVLGVLCMVLFIVVLSRTPEDRFEFYYAARAKQRFGVYDLDEYLDRWEWVEGSYVMNIFDCTEMSGYLEWRLESEGYHTRIVVGQCPWEPTTKHAWLLVETSEGKYMPVEATAYGVVWWSSQYFDAYFEYDYSFETIFDALDYDPYGFDWWEG